MLPELAAGSIDRIVTGEDVTNAVVQLLGCKRIPGLDGDRYRLLISDGVTGNPFVMLGTKLNHMVLNKELEKFSILRIDEYVCNAVAMDRSVIILTKLTVLVPGNEVNEKLGNPVNKSTGGASSGAATNTSVIGGSVQSNMIPQLTTGAINRILNGENVPNPVLQVLGCKKVPTNEHYCLLISDGAFAFPFAVLGLQLNHMVANKQLICHTIVKVDEYKCHSEKKVINLLKLTVLAPGQEVKKQLGNPVNSFFNATTTGSAEKGVDKTCDSKMNTVSHQNSSAKKGSAQLMMQMMFPELTNGAINRILNGEDVANAVIQILGCEKIGSAGKYRYSLLISDGVAGSPFALLGPELNHLVTNKELEEFAIVQVKKCTCEVIADRDVIILLRLNVVVPGSEVNEKLGNPVIPTIDTHAEPAVNASELVLLSQLSNGAIVQILGDEVVENAVVLIIGCKKMPGSGDDLYHVTIFDGVMAWPFTKLGTQLNHFGENKELTRCPVRVDKYVCNTTPGKPKEIILLGLTVLGPGNELGDPINSSDAGATTGAMQQLKIV